MRKTEHNHFKAKALLTAHGYLEQLGYGPLSNSGVGISPRDQTSGEVIVYLWGETISPQEQTLTFNAKLRLLPDGSFHTGCVTIGDRTRIFHADPEIVTA